jgi:hypothetical protein
MELATILPTPTHLACPFRIACASERHRSWFGHLTTLSTLNAPKLQLPAQITTVKDVQAHLRHSMAKTTLEHYIKSVPEIIRVAVESLDHLLKSKPDAEKAIQANANSIEP